MKTVIDSKFSEVVILSLEAVIEGEEYFLCVRSRNSIGPSEYSGPTLTRVPPGRTGK